MVPGKELFTLPVALPRINPVGMFPWSSEVVSKTEKLPSHAGKEIPILYLSFWLPVGSPGVSRGSTHGESNDKCIKEKLRKYVNTE